MSGRVVPTFSSVKYSCGLEAFFRIISIYLFSLKWSMRKFQLPLLSRDTFLMSVETGTLSLLERTLHLKSNCFFSTLTSTSISRERVPSSKFYCRLRSSLLISFKASGFCCCLLVTKFARVIRCKYNYSVRELSKENYFCYCYWLSSSSSSVI